MPSTRATSASSTHAGATVHTVEPEERDDELAEENALIAVVRAAIARRDGDAALSAAERHARRFPSGRLAEERDSSRVQALALRGEYDAARAHAARFRRVYPASFFQPVIDAALRDAP